MQELQAYVESISLADLPNVLKQTQEAQSQSPTWSGHDLEMRLLRKWSAQGDARVVAEMVLQTPDANQADALAAVVGVWAQRDLAGAAVWAKQLPDGNERQSALRSVADAEVFTHPKEAVELAYTLPENVERNDLIMRATSQWADRTPDEVLTWAGHLLEGDLHDQAIAAVAATWSQQDPVAAVNLAVDTLPNGPYQEASIIAVVRSWSARDPGAASEWIRQFPDDKLRQSAMQVLNDVVQRSTAGTISR